MKIAAAAIIAALTAAAPAPVQSDSAVARLAARGLVEQDRIAGIPLDHRVLRPQSMICNSADNMLEVIQSVAANDFSHFASIPGCLATRSVSLPVAVLGYPHPLVAMLRVKAPAQLNMPVVYALVSFVIDSDETTPVEVPLPRRRRS